MAEIEKPVEAPTAPPAPDDLNARRAAAEEILSKKRLAKEKEAQLREVVLLETRAKYEEELGPEGEAFAVVDAGAEGPIVLKPGPMVLYKEYRSKVLKEEITLEAAQKYVLPCVVFPDKPVVLGILAKRPALHDDLVVALHGLHGQNEALARGKS